MIQEFFRQKLETGAKGEMNHSDTESKMGDAR
jgi:hypothetical protein